MPPVETKVAQPSWLGLSQIKRWKPVPLSDAEMPELGNGISRPGACGRGDHSVLQPPLASDETALRFKLGENRWLQQGASKPLWQAERSGGIS
jgi:hypothetical protein